MSSEVCFFLPALCLQDRLVLSFEQELVRVHQRAFPKHYPPLSVCTVLTEALVLPHPPRAHSRSNSISFCSQPGDQSNLEDEAEKHERLLSGYVQDVWDKFHQLSIQLARRHRTEMETLWLSQMQIWRGRLREQGLDFYWVLCSSLSHLYGKFCDYGFLDILSTHAQWRWRPFAVQLHPSVSRSCDSFWQLPYLCTLTWWLTCQPGQNRLLPVEFMNTCACGVMLCCPPFPLPWPTLDCYLSEYFCIKVKSEMVRNYFICCCIFWGWQKAFPFSHETIKSLLWTSATFLIYPQVYIGWSVN